MNQLLAKYHIVGAEATWLLSITSSLIWSAVLRMSKQRQKCNK